MQAAMAQDQRARLAAAPCMSLGEEENYELTAIRESGWPERIGPDPLVLKS
jgi:hypothetical protein